MPAVLGEGCVTDRYRPNLVLLNAEKGCACCGLLWYGGSVDAFCACGCGNRPKNKASKYASGHNGNKHGAGVKALQRIKPAWVGAQVAVCKSCLRRFLTWLEERAVPTDRAENFLLFAWVGYETVQRQWKAKGGA